MYAGLAASRRLTPLVRRSAKAADASGSPARTASKCEASAGANTARKNIACFPTNACASWSFSHATHAASASKRVSLALSVRPKASAVSEWRDEIGRTPQPNVERHPSSLFRRDSRLVDHRREFRVRVIRTARTLMRRARQRREPRQPNSRLVAADRGRGAHVGRTAAD
jgi:hypothetical protein